MTCQLSIDDIGRNPDLRESVLSVLRPNGSSTGVKIDSTPSRNAAKSIPARYLPTEKTHFNGRARDVAKFCQEKIRYATSHEAQRTIRGMARHGKARNMRSYRCPHCHGWHITRS